jgi:hypothetical protein
MASSPFPLWELRQGKDAMSLPPKAIDHFGCGYAALGPFVLLPVILLYSFAEVHAAISVSLLTSMVDATSRALANVRPLSERT